MRGASLTMLHQPTPRNDFLFLATETGRVVDALGTAAVIVFDPFLAVAPVLSERGVNVFVIADLLASEDIDPLDTDEDDIRCCS